MKAMVGLCCWDNEIWEIQLEEQIYLFKAC